LERHSIPAKRIHECVLLHVEDDDGAAYLFQTALRQTDLRQFFRVSNGEDAMAFLLQQGAYSFALRIPMMSISHSDLMPIRSERSDAGLSQCGIVIGISQDFCLFLRLDGAEFLAFPAVYGFGR
jgi:hypothetical protein